MVVRFIDYTNEFPWTWTPAMVEEFFGDLRSIRRVTQSTIRSYQTSLKLFCAYISNPDYGWDRLCEQRFGTHPAQVFFEWNSAAHVQDNESTPTKRAFTKTELQELCSTTPIPRSRQSPASAARVGYRRTATP